MGMVAAPGAHSVEPSVMPCLHHVHHDASGRHEVHHCSGEYTVVHCRCGLHAIDVQYIRLYAHAMTEVATVVEFMSPCLAQGVGWWHCESGVRR